MRRPTACTECRSTKRRCIRSNGQAKCNQCLRREGPCSLERSLHIPLFHASPPGPADETSCSAIFRKYGDEAVIEMIRSYLELIHDRPHSLFHISTLWKDIEEKQIQPALLLSLCAMGSRLCPKPAVRNIAQHLTGRAKETLQSGIENISIETIQACILLANIYAAELEPTLEALYFGMANRMAQILKLNRTDPTLCIVQREINCRIWWTLVMADNWCSAGLGIPRQLTAEGDDVPLPFDEYSFQRLEAGHSEAPASAATEGLWAHMIRLVGVLGPIHELNRSVAGGRIESDTADRQASNISNQLDNWLSTLPGHLAESEHNLQSYRSRGFGGPFVALHLGYHHYSTLLYFRYLDTDHTDISLAKIYSDRCRYHASSYSQLLRRSKELSGCEAVYATVGHMTVVSSSVLLHTLLIGDKNELKKARSDLISNFEALIELKKYWPCLERIMGRLLVFQEACLHDDASSTHRVDQWMVKFLTEHSLPLDKRVSPPPADLYSTPAESINSPVLHTSPHARERMANQALSALWSQTP